MANDPYGGTPGARYGAGAPDAHGYPPPQPRNGVGIAALVLGIVALLSSWTVIGGILFGLLAIIVGFVARGRVKRREATNGGMAITGIVLGLVSVLVAALAAYAVGTYIFGREDVQTLRQCLEEAGNDRAAQQECQRDLQEQQR